MSHFCPQCGFEIQDSSIEVCPSCSFDFNTTISCPYLISNRCVHTREICDINGLDYELCRIYLTKSGIIKTI